MPDPIDHATGINEEGAKQPICMMALTDYGSFWFVKHRFDQLFFADNLFARQVCKTST